MTDSTEPALADAHAASADAQTEPSSEPARRTFLRQLSGDAVSTAGRLAGFSSIIRRTVVAAGVTAARGLEATVEEKAPAGATPGSTITVEMPAPSPGPEPASAAGTIPPAPAAGTIPPASRARERPDPVLALSPAQHDFLTGAISATMAVNDPAGPPHLTSSMFHWDGSMIRLPAQLFTARATNVDRDPRISLLVHGSTSETWVAITGAASICYGEQAADDTRQILAKYHGPDEVARRWEEMAAEGDRIVIQVRPTRFVWPIA